MAFSPSVPFSKIQRKAETIELNEKRNRLRIIKKIQIIRGRLFWNEKKKTSEIVFFSFRMWFDWFCCILNRGETKTKSCLRAWRSDQNRQTARADRSCLGSCFPDESCVGKSRLSEARAKFKRRFT